MKEKNMYKELPPFKWFVLQNFPFIEEDFDAITNYQLLCKIVEYLNLNINKTNELGEQVEALTNWFDNLDVQDEVDNKLDDMAESGELAEIINEQIFNELNTKIDNLDDKVDEEIYNVNYKTSISQLIDLKIFAQLIPNIDLTGFYFSGFAIGNDLLLVAVNDGINTNTGKIFLYNITSGLVVDYLENQPIGHANDITFCNDDNYFYVACGGGNNSLNKICIYGVENNELVFIRDIDVSEFNNGTIFGIAYDYDNKNFITLQNNNIIKYDSTFENVIDTKELISQNVEYAQQSIFYFNNYIGNIINTDNELDIYCNFNKIDIYNTNLDYVQSSKIMQTGEIESGFYYNNELYLLLQTQNQGILYKGNFIQNNKTYNIINQNLIYNNRFPFTGNNDIYYVDSTYKGFFVDGSSVKPFNNLRVALRNIRNTRNITTLYLTGDFSDVEISIGGRTFTNHLEIRGTDNSNYTKIGGLNLNCLPYLVLTNLEITKSTSAINYLINLESVQYAYISNIKFKGQGTENAGLRGINSTINLSNCIFDSNFVDYNIYLSEDSSLQTSGTFEINNNKGNQFSIINKHLWYQIPTSQLTNNNAWKTNILGGNITFNIKDIKLDGDYRVEGGNTCSDAPSGYTDNAFRLNVQNISNSIIYKLIPYHENKLFIGVLAESQSNITWEEII